MLPAHEKNVRKLFDVFKTAGEELAAAIKIAYPIGTLVDVRLGRAKIPGRISGYSPTNPREVWFVYETTDRSRGRHAKFCVGHDDAKVTRYAL